MLLFIGSDAAQGWLFSFFIYDNIKTNVTLSNNDNKPIKMIRDISKSLDSIFMIANKFVNCF